MDIDDEPMLKIRSRTDCPCGSKKMYFDCCRPYHIGKAQPATAELLMRSRYSAFFFRLVGYLVSSTHPDVREKTLHEELDNMVDGMLWRNLRIISKSKGTAEDKKGKVEFIAQYHFDGEFLELHENSRFRKYKGQWKYVDDKG
jgi:SEC-C motif-containing protein